MTITMTSRLATEDTDVRVTIYNGAEIATYRNIKQAMHDRGTNELRDDGVWYWHLSDNRGNGPFISEEGALMSARRAIDLSS